MIRLQRPVAILLGEVDHYNKNKFAKHLMGTKGRGFWLINY